MSKRTQAQEHKKQLIVRTNINDLAPNTKVELTCFPCKMFVSPDEEVQIY